LSDISGVDRSVDNTADFLVFHSSGQHCAFPLGEVQEVVPMARLSTPPGLPSLLAGFLDLGGTAIPILRFDRLFHLPPQLAGLYTPLIILRQSGGQSSGILVEGVKNIVRAQPSALLPLPSNQVFQDCATSSIEVDGDAIHILSLERILLEKERRIVAEFQVKEQERLRDLVGDRL
jgi:purine-binding chemotaxis protein CheW